MLQRLKLAMFVSGRRKIFMIHQFKSVPRARLTRLMFRHRVSRPNWSHMCLHRKKVWRKRYRKIHRQHIIHPNTQQIISSSRMSMRHMFRSVSRDLHQPQVRPQIPLTIRLPAKKNRNLEERWVHLIELLFLVHLLLRICTRYLFSTYR